MKKKTGAVKKKDRKEEKKKPKKKIKNKREIKRQLNFRAHSARQGPFAL